MSFTTRPDFKYTQASQLGPGKRSHVDYRTMIRLGGRSIGATGFGLMGLTRPESPLPTQRCFDVMNKALDCGANYWNAGEFYGTQGHNSLHLLRNYFATYPNKASQVTLCIKGGRTPEIDGDGYSFDFDGTLHGVGRSINECNRVLDGTKKIDIFECARVDPRTPIEHTVSVLDAFVKAGKIGGIGLSEVRAETIRRAHQVHEIAQVEVEMSLWASEPLRNGIVDVCAELNIPIMAYSPLSRGGLSASIASDAEQLPEHLKILPRFQGSSFTHNMRLTEQLSAIAADKGCSMPQLALGWLRTLSGTEGRGKIVPIPGAEQEDWIEENCGPIMLKASEMQRITAILDSFAVQGQRYGGEVEERCDG